MITRNSLFLILLLSFIATPSFALKSDRDQPALIEADDIEFDFNKGTRKYHGNVLVVQGTLRIKADKLHAFYKGDELVSVKTWGNLARFKSRPDGKEDDVEGSAKRITVDYKKNILTLIGKASLKQGPQTARGETIIYNMDNDTLKLKGSAKVGAAGKNGKTVPKRTIEDPFADEAKTKSTKTGSKSGTSKQTEQQKSVETIPQPTKSGRSRLIIKPKSLKKDKDKNKDNENKNK